MNIQKGILVLFTVAVGFAMIVGCASPRNTEGMLSEAGFSRFQASTFEQTNHVQSLPADRLTAIQLSGKTFYVFPDPARNQIFIGNTEQYQTYQQIQSYSEL